MTSSSMFSADLQRLASNYAWTWDLELRVTLVDCLGADWSGHRHPLAAIGRLTDQQLELLSADNELAARVAAGAAKIAALEAESIPLGTPANPVEFDTAYISAEFGISETLPQYSGGLGILAGDHLKAASDLRVSLVAVGLFYANGYFTQSVDANGQVVSYDTYDPRDLGLSDSGVVISIETPRGPVLAAVWLARIGSVRLYMLDTRVDGNPVWATQITDRLYGGDQRHRIDQEMLLGVGGLRALADLGLEPKMVHLNEGHAGFCLLEMLALRIMNGESLPEAQANVQSRTLFTTHTPVPAGIDRFPRSLLEPYLTPWSASTGIPIATIWAEGQLPSDNAPDEFNMAAFCLGHAAIINGVSELHGTVSQELFASRPEGSTITSVTNGVHARSWTDPVAQTFLDRHLGPSDDRSSGWASGDPAAWANVASIPADEIVGLRSDLRKQLVDSLNANHGTALDPNALTIGFARRFATYKRAALLLRHPERLAALLGDDDRPVQFVFAGKAHPADVPGQAILKEIAAYSATAAANHRFVLVPGYDIELAGLLYAGCDVWLNTPVRPQEACGTSGEKSVLNGGVNCSILDGWWAEWFDAANGWAIPTSELRDHAKRDDAEAAALLDLLETEVVPAFYGTADSTNPSEAWVERIRVGWQILGPKVTAGRMVAEYRDRLYQPIISALT